MLKISVVTTVFNRRKTIAQAMDSVAAQDYGNVEHIVQDGGSTDGTLEVITRHSGVHVSLESTPDSGIYDGINRGISRASGDVIGLMHSDDFFASAHVLSNVAAAFSDSADGVYGDLDYVSSEDPHKVIRKWRSGSYNATLLRKGWMPPHPTLYLRREVFERWGLYDTRFRIAADYDAMLRYLVRGEIKLTYVPEVMVKMRVGGESNRSLARIWQKSREDYQAIRRHQVGGFKTLFLKNATKLGQFVGH